MIKDRVNPAMMSDVHNLKKRRVILKLSEIPRIEILGSSIISKKKSIITLWG